MHENGNPITNNKLENYTSLNVFALSLLTAIEAESKHPQTWKHISAKTVIPIHIMDVWIYIYYPTSYFTYF